MDGAAQLSNETAALKNAIDQGLQEAERLLTHQGWSEARRLAPPMGEEFDWILGRIQEMHEALRTGGTYDLPTTLHLAEKMTEMIGHMQRLRESLDLREYGPPEPPKARQPN